MIYLGGSENYVQDCDISQPGIAKGGPLLCTAIVVNPAGGAVYVGNSHLSDFNTGISVQGSENSLTRLFCSNVICECVANGLIIQPKNSNFEIYDVFCSDCIFMQETMSTDETAGVYIDTGGQPNSSVANIFLNNCMSFGWNGPGVQINAGSNIVITGGCYSSNASGKPMSGGIAVTGTAANVTIVGADCTAKLPDPDFPSQPNALAVTAAVEGLYVRGCNFSGYSGIPIYLSSAGTQIEITDCAGYNDQGTVLQQSAHAPTNPITNTSAWANAPNGWFGPVTFYIKGAGAVSIGNATIQYNTHLTDGEYTLSSGEVASVAGTATSFLAIGR